MEENRILPLLLEALAAGALGALGAVARVANTGRPILSAGFLVHTLAGGSLGTGAWLIGKAMALDGWWLFAVSWMAGTLGYAVLHDLLLRLINRRLGGP